MMRLLVVFVHEHYLSMLTKSQSLGPPKSLDLSLKWGCRVGSITGGGPGRATGHLSEVAAIESPVPSPEKGSPVGEVSGDPVSISR